MSILIIAFAMIPAACTAFYFGEKQIGLGLVFSAGITAAIAGGFLIAMKPSRNSLKPREGYLVVCGGVD